MPNVFKNISDAVVITCFDESFNILGYVDEFKSLSWTTSYSGIGSFSIVVNTSNSKSMNLLRQTTFIVVHNIPSRVRHERTKEPIVSGIITEIVHDYKPSGDTFTVKGSELKAISKRRIIIRDITYTSTYTNDMMKDLLNDNLLAPSQSYRTVAGEMIKTSTSTAEGEAPDTYSNLADSLTQLAEAGEIGWMANVDTNEITGEYGISWLIYDGIDRTGTGTADKMLLSFSNDTLQQGNYKINVDDLQNVAVVGGQGEGSERTIVKVYDTETNPTGIHRYETFVDARNEETTAELQSKGREALAQYESTDIIKLTPSWLFLRRFGADYFVGDVVKFEELDAEMRLTESTITFEGNSITCSLTFGYKADDFKSAMRIMLRNYKNMLNT